MKKDPRRLTPQKNQRLSQRYQELAERLSRVGSISQGSVMHAPPGAWRWTRKVKAKTVSVALSAAQAELMKQAIANQRDLDGVIDEMREITQQLILGATPGVPRRPRSKLPNRA
jgi:hypothetical protein